MAKKTEETNAKPRNSSPLDRALLSLIQTLPERFETVAHDLATYEEVALQYLVDCGYVEMEVNVSYPVMSFFQPSWRHFACIISGVGWMDAIVTSLKGRRAAFPAQVKLANERIAHRLTTAGIRARDAVAEGEAETFLSVARRRNGKLQYAEFDIDARRALWKQVPAPRNVTEPSPMPPAASAAPPVEVHAPPITVQNQIDLEPLVKALQDARSTPAPDTQAEKKKMDSGHSAGVEALAIALLYQHPDWTNTQIAEVAGCHEKYLSSKKLVKFRAARVALKGSSIETRPRGWKTKNGQIEAIEDDPADDDFD